MIKKILFNKMIMRIVFILDLVLRKFSNYRNYSRLYYLIPNRGRNIIFDKTTTFKYPENIIVGDDVKIGPNVSIGAFGGVVLGNNVRISQNAIIESAGLDLKSNIPYKHKGSRVIIEDDVWIGGSAVINQGVTIGARSVIAANSVVNHDVPPGCLYGGAPAKLIKRLD